MGLVQIRHRLFMKIGSRISPGFCLGAPIHTVFRTSIQWSRIFSTRLWKVNPQGVDFYRKVLWLTGLKEFVISQSLCFDFILPFKRMVMVGKIRRQSQPEDYARFVLRLMEFSGSMDYL